MLKLVFVALFWVQAFARPNTDSSIESHIIGGTPAKEGQFPFAVSFRHAETKEHYCGGALISDRYVLTAAHCVETKQPSWELVGVGSVNLDSQKLYKVDKIIIHPPSDVFPLFDDIALVRLSSPVPLGGNVQTILPYSTNDTLDGKMATSMGWGQTSENETISKKLLYINKPIIANDVCQKGNKHDIPVGPGNICTAGQVNHGISHHDSGSPLAYKAADGKTYVVGLVVWSLECGKGYPDVFTRVSHYTKWIKENMK